MYHTMNGLGWFWMSFLAVLWIVALGAVVFFAVRLAERSPHDGNR